MTVDEILAQFRLTLLQTEEQTARELTEAYARIVERLQVQQQQLVAQIAGMRAQGAILTAEQIRQLAGFQRLLEDTQREMDAYAMLVRQTVERNTETAVQVGLDQARATILAQVPPAMQAQVLAVFNRISREAILAMVTMLQEGSPLSQTLARYGAEAAQGIGDTLLEALLRGDGPREAARRMLKEWGVGLSDALRISRTEMLRAQRWATLEGFRNNADVVIGWTWCAQLDDRTCLSCVALHGTEFPLTETMDDHPNGRCEPLPMTRSWAELGFTGMSDLEMPEPGDGERWFRGLDKAKQQAMMGKGKYKAWKAGKFEFAALSQAVYDQDWGRTFVEASLKSLLG